MGETAKVCSPAKIVLKAGAHGMEERKGREGEEHFGWRVARTMQDLVIHTKKFRLQPEGY